MYRCLIALILGSLIPIVGQAGEERRPTLAIIGTDATRDASDLLFAGLSGTGFAEFVEREEIDRILQEQELSLTTENSILRLSGLVAADGLILLTIQRDENGLPFLLARLVAVRPGVVLDLVRIPWPDAETYGWVSRVESQFGPLLPKLFVMERDAVPISILNLRSAVTTSRSQETERLLTRILATRLTAEPEVFVLERTRTDLLREEKEIALDESAFWAGSYLIDGVIDGDHYSAGSISVSVRLEQRGGEKQRFEINSPREDLSQVVEAMARVILDGVDHGASENEWNIEEEALRYFDEGLWALRWGMYREARQATEAAWALGLRHHEVAALRARAYIPAAGLPSLAHENQRGHYRGNEIPLHFQSTQVRQGEEIPSFQSLQDVNRALRDYWAYSRKIAVESLEPDHEFYVAGTDLLRGASVVLLHFHFTRASSAETELAEARALCRRIAAWLFDAPAIRRTYVFDPNDHRDEFRHRFIREPNIFRSIAAWGRFWQETPEEGVDLWRTLMAYDVFPAVRHNLLESGGRVPFLPAWRRGDAARSGPIMDDFVKELLESADPLLRLEGRMLALAVPRFHPYGDPDAFSEITAQVMEPAFEALFADIEAYRDALVHAPSDRDLGTAIQILRRRWSGIVTPATERIHRRIREMQQVLREIDNDHRRLPARLTAEEALQEQLDLLRGGLAVAPDEFLNKFRHLPRDKDDAKKLQTHLNAYRLAIQSATETTVNEEGGRADLLIAINRIERSLEAQMSAAPSVRSPVVEEDVAWADFSETPVLNVNRKIRIPVEAAGFIPGGRVSICARSVENGRIVYFAAYQEPGGQFDPWKFLGARLDLQTLEWEVHRAPLPPASSEIGLPSAAIHGNEFLIPHRGGFSRWRFGSDTREVVTLPFDGSPRVQSVNGRFFASDNAMILEIDERGNDFQVLASTRRNPPVTPMDKLDRFRDVKVIPALAGDVHLCVNDILYRHGADGWEEMHRFRFAAIEIHSDVTLFREDRGAIVWILTPDADAPDLLYDISDPRMVRAAAIAERDRIRQSNPERVSLSRFDLADRQPDARLSLLERLVERDTAIHPMGESMFLFHDNVAVNWEESPPRVEMKEGRHANLFHIERKGARPTVIPLRFEEFLPAEAFTRTPIPAGRPPGVRYAHSGFELFVSGTRLIIFTGNNGWIADLPVNGPCEADTEKGT